LSPKFSKFTPVSRKMRDRILTSFVTVGNLNPVPRLTHGLAQKSELGQLVDTDMITPGSAITVPLIWSTRSMAWKFRASKTNGT
jgi:hypothetical protein